MSPTIQTLFIGFGLLATMTVIGKLLAQHKGIVSAIKIFFPIWFVYTAWHMSVGMSHGYSFISELFFLLLNFGLPALAAWWYLKKHAA